MSTTRLIVTLALALTAFGANSLLNRRLWRAGISTLPVSPLSGWSPARCFSAR